MLARNGYLFARRKGEHEWAAIIPFMFTYGIIVRTIEGQSYGYEDRWCYHFLDEALVAFVAWEEKKFEGEPEGWHRHPASGRRRPKGNAAREYINP